MLSSAYHTRALLSLSVSEAMEVCTSNTPSPQAQPMEVCVCALRFRSLLVRLASHSLSYIRTYFHRVYVDSIYPLSKESSLCVCVCGSMSPSLPQMEVCVHPRPRPRPRSPSPFPFPFSLFPIPTPLSLYVVLPHISYPTSTCFSHPISICGHRTVKAPYPVRSAKLSTVSTS